MTDFSRPYASKWRLYRIDPRNWSEQDEVGGVISASISRNSGGMLESGSIELDSPIGGGFDEGYYRLVLNATQDGRTERHDISTLYCSRTSGVVDRRYDRKTLTGRSVLVPASGVAMPMGSFLPKGSDAVAYVARILGSTLAAPVVAVGSFTLADDYVFDIGSKVLDVVWTVLNAGGWTMFVDGSGVVTVAKLPSEPTIDMPEDMAGVLYPEISYETDLIEVPNRYVAIDDSGNMAYAVNDSPNSLVSTVSRGFIVDADMDTSPTLLGGETLAEYCRRRLTEASVVSDTRSYTREYIPNLLPDMLIRGTLSTVGMTGAMRIDNQSLECGVGVVVSESSKREVALWT